MRRIACLLAALALLLVWAGIATAKDLVLVDAKMGDSDRIHNRAGVMPPVNGQCYSAFVNPHDSSGWTVYDTLWRAILTYRYEDNRLIEVHNIDWSEWMVSLMIHTREPGNLDYPNVSIGPKKNQATGTIGSEEARRWWTPNRFDDFWPITAEPCVIPVNGTDCQPYIRPYYSNRGFLIRFAQVPDTNLLIGYNPSHFRYLVVHCSPLFVCADTVFVQTDVNANCSRIFWTPDDLNHPDYPSTRDSAICDILPDSTNPCLHHLNPLIANLLPGSYDVKLKSVGGFQDEDRLVHSEPWTATLDETLDIQLTAEECGQNPQVAEFWQNGQLIRAVPLAYRETRACIYPNVPPIPAEGDDR